MTTSQTRATKGAVTPEELGYLVGGPGRAAETAIAGLLDAGRIRISREGVITAVSGHWNPTPLQAQVMSGHHGHLSVVTKAVAFSPAADALREHLINRGLVHRKRGGKLHTVLWTFAILIFGAGIVFEAKSLVPFIGVSIGLVVLAQFFRPRKPLTSAGRRVVRKAVPRGRVEAVAVHGLRGKINGRPVAAFFELPEDVVRQLPTRSSKKRSSDSTSSCGSGCGGSSCSSDSSGGGSSCGGGGCGGGGGD